LAAKKVQEYSAFEDGKADVDDDSFIMAPDGGDVTAFKYSHLWVDMVLDERMKKIFLHPLSP